MKMIDIFAYMLRVILRGSIFLLVSPGTRH